MKKQKLPIYKLKDVISIPYIRTGDIKNETVRKDFEKWMENQTKPLVNKEWDAVYEHNWKDYLKLQKTGFNFWD